MILRGADPVQPSGRRGEFRHANDDPLADQITAACLLNIEELGSRMRCTRTRSRWRRSQAAPYDRNGTRPRPPALYSVLADRQMTDVDGFAEEHCRGARRRLQEVRQFLAEVQELIDKRTRFDAEFGDLDRSAGVRVPTSPRRLLRTLGAEVPLPIYDNSAECCGTIPPGKG